MTTELQRFLDKYERKSRECANDDLHGKMPYCTNCIYNRDYKCLANNKRRNSLSLCANAWNSADDYLYGVYLYKGFLAKVIKSKTIEKNPRSGSFILRVIESGNTFRYYVKEKYIFLNKGKADVVASNINSKIQSFKYVPYVDTEYLIANYKTLKEIENAVDKELSIYADYNGIDFCDVSAGGIQIRVHHKGICAYTVGNQFTLKYDLSNGREAVESVISEFKRINNSEYIKDMKDFIRIGEATGWK